VRAAVVDLSAGGTRQGASTITQQVVREKYLSREQTLERKFNEVLLATRYERDLRCPRRGLRETPASPVASARDRAALRSRDPAISSATSREIASSNR